METCRLEEVVTVYLTSGNGTLFYYLLVCFLMLVPIKGERCWHFEDVSEDSSYSDNRDKRTSFRRFLVVFFFPNQTEYKTSKYKLSSIKERVEGYSHLPFLYFKRNQITETLKDNIRKKYKKLHMNTNRYLFF